MVKAALLTNAEFGCVASILPSLEDNLEQSKSDCLGIPLSKSSGVNFRVRAQLSDNGDLVLMSRGWRYVDNAKIYKCTVEAAFPL
jgi:hypothetical protein